MSIHLKVPFATFFILPMLFAFASCAQVVSNNFDEEDEEELSIDNKSKEKKSSGNEIYGISSSSNKDNSSSNSNNNNSSNSNPKNPDLYKIDSIYVHAHKETVHTESKECVIIVADDPIEYVDPNSMQFYLTDYFYIIEDDTLEYYQDIIDSTCIVYGEPYVRKVYIRIDTVIINNQTWMSENLFSNKDIGYCYDDNPEKCTDYGALYTWEQATTICPKGWRLPSKQDFESLIESAGGPTEANKILKSLNGWQYGINGYNDLFFAIYPAGYRTEKGVYQGGIGEEGGTETCFWSSTQDDSSNEKAYCMYVSLEYTESYWKERDIILKPMNKNSAVSIRCVKE